MNHNCRLCSLDYSSTASGTEDYKGHYAQAIVWLAILVFFMPTFFPLSSS